MNPTPTPDSPAPVDIARLRELEAKATPVPWKHVDEYADEPEHCIVKEGEQFYCMVAKCVIDDENGNSHQEIADAELIAALRNDAPALLDEVTEFRSICEEYGWEPAQGMSHVKYLRMIAEEDGSLSRAAELKHEKSQAIAERDKLRDELADAKQKISVLRQHQSLGDDEFDGMMAERNSLRQQNEQLLKEIEELRARPTGIWKESQ